ncbi:MAG TPA: GNAT family N-acetyltransferase [Acidobacteriaceae bacterium]|jgi:predicted GNAT superfamily acetyltransferase|nr:GNAT family N-acetyltransferase [Acidobacteriaceae bacterium]
MSAAVDPQTMQTASGTQLVLRSAQGFDELEACVRLQIETWGYDETDVIPRRLFTVAQRIGGQAIGAFEGPRMVGMAMSLPGVKAPKADGTLPAPYLHSHMLAVSPGHRNLGIGRRLKLYQREEALSRGIGLMEWTFDPLEIKNAFLNIHRLGVIVRSYTPNFYGVSSSRLQGGLPTDRLHAEWWMESERVKAILHGTPTQPQEIQETIQVPKAISEWKASSVPEAEAVQAENRRRFLDAFARGLAVVGFRVDAEGNGIYELARTQTTGVL